MLWIIRFILFNKDVYNKLIMFENSLVWNPPPPLKDYAIMVLRRHQLREHTLEMLLKWTLDVDSCILQTSTALLCKIGRKRANQLDVHMPGKCINISKCRMFYEQIHHKSKFHALFNRIMLDGFSVTWWYLPW